MFYFEELPDEILLDLFENYIRLIDVYLGFYLTHNHRIVTILKSARFCIDIPSKDIYHAVSIAQFGSQIISLNLSVFCKDLDLSKLVNLQFLCIKKPTQTQLLSIEPKVLPNLQTLSLYPCWYHMNELPDHLIHMETSCSFQHLRRCVLPDKKILRFPLKWQS
ncbi:hypothetical protein I4U23_015056 [Adineta vaga]|nr:hypothetical protein I4U23_015056 [Adineta vaga]